VARVAGNFINDDILGSMESPTKVAGAKVGPNIRVMKTGGPYMRAMDGAKFGPYPKMLQTFNRRSDIYSATGPRSSLKQNCWFIEVSEKQRPIAMQKINQGKPVT